MKQNKLFKQILKSNNEIVRGLNSFIFPIIFTMYFQIVYGYIDNYNRILIIILFIFSTINYFYVCFWESDKK
jgi:hypothetical protein